MTETGAMTVATRELLHRFEVLAASPAWLALPAADKDALARRVEVAQDQGKGFLDLPAGDRELLRTGALEVSAGLSPSLRNPLEWGDWQAIDAAIDAEDEAALDTALLSVGGPRMAAALDASDDEPEFPDDDAVADDGTELDDAGDGDDGGWVGL